ncbi:MAG: RagB/SusD family nutrient uptake outer membrane protein [Tannerella sp.]|jgi:hypothetical protein|nr:RagB/SusD family nutrient uptake outer membrane protein [Tannerella sp.]
MKNMNIKNILAGCIGLFFMGTIISCDDFLKEEPKTNMDLAQSYKSASQARAGINRLYNSGYPTFYGAGVYNGATIAWGAYLSGFYDNEYKGQEVIVQYSQELTVSKANIANQMKDLWRDTYKGIANANTAIKYIPDITDAQFDEGERELLVAQAKFFRAINYFHLVKFYGDVPLITEPYESTDQDLYIARTPSAEVYARIEKDLTEAIPHLANEAFVKNGYRISKTTAQTLLANVYLQMSGYPLQNNKYADAAAAARNVINSGKHGLTQNEDEDQRSAYNILRKENDLTEIIYSRERSATITEYQDRWTQLSFPIYAAAWGIFKYTLTNNGIRPVPELINVYDPENDLRIQERQFYFSEYPDQNGNISKFEQPSPWYYLDEEAMFVTGVSGRNFPIFRYAEILLIAAEAIAQSEGVTAEAVSYLADVRARAYTKMTKADIVTSLSGLSKDAFIQEVWTERLRELSLEFKIWDDIQRTRKYPATTSGNKGKVTYIDVVGAKNHWGATFQEKHLLWPISEQETQRNPQLIQNPGY